MVRRQPKYMVPKEDDEEVEITKLKVEEILLSNDGSNKKKSVVAVMLDDTIRSDMISSSSSSSSNVGSTKPTKKYNQEKFEPRRKWQSLMYQRQAQLYTQRRNVDREHPPSYGNDDDDPILSSRSEGDDDFNPDREDDGRMPNYPMKDSRKLKSLSTSNQYQVSERRQDTHSRRDGEDDRQSVSTTNSSSSNASKVNEGGGNVEPMSVFSDRERSKSMGKLTKKSDIVRLMAQNEQLKREYRSMREDLADISSNKKSQGNHPDGGQSKSEARMRSRTTATATTTTEPAITTGTKLHNAMWNLSSTASMNVDRYAAMSGENNSAKDSKSTSLTRQLRGVGSARSTASASEKGKKPGMSSLQHGVEPYKQKHRQQYRHKESLLHNDGTTVLTSLSTTSSVASRSVASRSKTSSPLSSSFANRWKQSKELHAANQAIQSLSVKVEELVALNHEKDQEAQLQKEQQSAVVENLQDRVEQMASQECKLSRDLIHAREKVVHVKNELLQQHEQEVEREKAERDKRHALEVELEKLRASNKKLKEKEQRIRSAHNASNYQRKKLQHGFGALEQELGIATAVQPVKTPNKLITTGTTKSGATFNNKIMNQDSDIDDGQPYSSHHAIILELARDRLRTVEKANDNLRVCNRELTQMKHALTQINKSMQQKLKNQYDYLVHLEWTHEKHRQRGMMLISAIIVIQLLFLSYVISHDDNYNCFK